MLPAALSASLMAELGASVLPFDISVADGLSEAACREAPWLSSWQYKALQHERCGRGEPDSPTGESPPRRAIADCVVPRAASPTAGTGACNT
jgi:hypothetical protein